MPIGVDTGEGRQPGRPPTPTRPPSPAPLPTTPPRGAPSTRIDAEPDLEVVVWTVWRTAVDERVCPVCGPLEGGEWPEGEGPMPPAHPNCRCARVMSRVEYRIRA